MPNYCFYNNKIVSFDLTNKFLYKDVTQIPKLKKIVLNLNCRNFNLKNLIRSLIALEIVTCQKSAISGFRKITIKHKKGAPIGCKLTLRKIPMYLFISKLIYRIWPKLKQFKGFKYNLTSQNPFSFSFQIENCLVFYELETHYSYFKNLSRLGVTIITNAKQNAESCFLLKSFKLPIKNK